MTRLARWIYMKRIERAWDLLERYANEQVRLTDIQLFESSITHRRTYGLHRLSRQEADRYSAARALAMTLAFGRRVIGPR